MYKTIVNILIFIVTINIVACVGDESADNEVRKMLGIGRNQQLTEQLVIERTGILFPIGTPESIIAEETKVLGIGKDKLSSYNVIKDNMVIIRFEYDVSTLAVTKSQWIISLKLDSDRKLRSVEAKRYLTGL